MQMAFGGYMVPESTEPELQRTTQPNPADKEYYQSVKINQNSSFDKYAKTKKTVHRKPPKPVEISSNLSPSGGKLGQVNLHVNLQTQGVMSLTQ